MALHWDIKDLTELVKKEHSRKYSAYKTLESLGYTFEGGEYWQPPLDKAPHYLRNTPKYVTFNVLADQICVWDNFTHDKDYKVLNVYDKGYIVENDLGIKVKIAKSFFYPEIEEIQNEGEDSFDNLVLNWDRETVYYLDFNKLSQEQIDFCYKYFKDNGLWDTYGDNLDVHLSFVLDENGLVWGNNYSSDEFDNTTTFNDLFVEKDAI